MAPCATAGNILTTAAGIRCRSRSLARESAMEILVLLALILAIVVIGITYFSLILGELVPKRLALHAPEAIATRVALPMRWLATATLPFVKLLTLSTEGLLRL
ncbi:MAG TPA: CNNM domain-containing protein, partial [Burkholderiaceae bacterium]|nr:CNNM domain-containing protein [Burkholderiaceae bacterium]